jgi:hypothetical protein
MLGVSVWSGSWAECVVQGEEGAVGFSGRPEEHRIYRGLVQAFAHVRMSLAVLFRVYSEGDAERFSHSPPS